VIVAHNIVNPRKSGIAKVVPNKARKAVHEICIAADYFPNKKLHNYLRSIKFVAKSIDARRNSSSLSMTSIARY
jgi:hypothetical protein